VLEQDVLAVESVLGGIVAAWNAHDMDAFGDLLWDDVVAVNYVGMLASGRDEFVAGLRAIHATIYRDSVLTTTTELVREIAPGVVVVVERNDLAGDARDPTVTFRQRSTTVLVQRNGGWRAASFQNTRLRDDVA
jgi:uncharacterized protein (TIGR02246 family)